MPDATSCEHAPECHNGILFLAASTVIQRCDSCDKFDSDLAAAVASGFPFTVRDRNTGEPCPADTDHEWDAVIDGSGWKPLNQRRIPVTQPEPITVVVIISNGSLDAIGVIADDVDEVSPVVVVYEEHADPGEEHLAYAVTPTTLESWPTDEPTDALRVCADELPPSAREKLGV